jgi:hypothetical protein
MRMVALQCFRPLLGSQRRIRPLYVEGQCLIGAVVSIPQLSSEIQASPTTELQAAGEPRQVLVNALTGEVGNGTALLRLRDLSGVDEVRATSFDFRVRF